MIAETPGTADAGAKLDESIAHMLGQRLGRYQLVMPLAQGGMGVVFAGRLVGAHGVERLVAIKRLRPSTSASNRAALLREARVTARVHHRNMERSRSVPGLGDTTDDTTTPLLHPAMEASAGGGADDARIGDERAAPP